MNISSDLWVAITQEAQNIIEQHGQRPPHTLPELAKAITALLGRHGIFNDQLIISLVALAQMWKDE